MSHLDFKEVYQLYFHDVYKYLLSISHNEDLAKELTQDTFVKAMENYDKFRGECKIQVWLCQIAKNSFYLHNKQNKRMIDTDLTTHETDDISFEIRLADKEQAFQIHKLLHDLPEPYKEVFSLRVLGELSFGDIARLLSKTESWARVTFHRAKLKIIQELKEDYHV